MFTPNKPPSISNNIIKQSTTADVHVYRHEKSCEPSVDIMDPNIKKLKDCVQINPQISSNIEKKQWEKSIFVHHILTIAQVWLTNE